MPSDNILLRDPDLDLANGCSILKTKRPLKKNKHLYRNVYSTFACILINQWMEIQSLIAVIQTLDYYKDRFDVKCSLPAWITHWYVCYTVEQNKCMWWVNGFTEWSNRFFVKFALAISLIYSLQQRRHVLAETTKTILPTAFHSSQVTPLSVQCTLKILLLTAIE